MLTCGIASGPSQLTEQRYTCACTDPPPYWKHLSVSSCTHVNCEPTLVSPTLTFTPGPPRLLPLLICSFSLPKWESWLPLPSVHVLNWSIPTHMDNKVMTVNPHPMTQLHPPARGAVNSPFASSITGSTYSQLCRSSPFPLIPFSKLVHTLAIQLDCFCRILKTPCWDSPNHLDNLKNNFMH